MTMAFRALMGACAIAALTVGASAQTTLTIATVNNSDMVRMQGLTDDFTAKHPDIALEWVTLEENVLRQNVTTDIATGGGQYDVITIGTYEVPIWAKQGWLVPLDDLPAEYNVDDLLPSIRAGLSSDGKLYAVPFYGESSFVNYRTDLAEAAGITIPDEPTWDDIKAAAAAMHDPDNGVYGICLRGKPGWGENMAFLTTMANSYGARWFDENWKPQFDSPAMEGGPHRLHRPADQVRPSRPDLQRLQREPDAVPPGPMRAEDRRHGRRAPSLVDPNQSTVADKVGLHARAGRGPRQARQLALGLGARHPVLVGRARRGQDLPRLGDWAGLRRPRGGLRGHRQRAARHADLALREPGVPGGGALRADDHRLDQRGRPDRSRPWTRCPIPASSSWPSPSSRASAPPSARSSRTRSPGNKTVDEALAEAQATATTDHDRGRLHQVGQPTPGAPQRPRPPRTGGRSHVHPSLALRRPADAVAGRHPAVDLDDRAAGADALVLVPALQPPVSRPRGLHLVSELLELRGLARLLGRDPQHAAPDLRRASHHRRRRHPHRAPDRPADLGPGAGAHPRHLAVLHHAAGGGADLEEHVHEPHQRPFRRGLQGPGAPARSSGSRTTRSSRSSSSSPGSGCPSPR